MASEPAGSAAAVTRLPAVWSYDGEIVNTFVDHIRQSVPLYDAGHELVCQAADYFVRDDSVCYELGASTGELLRKMACRHSQRPGVRWVGLDCVPQMIAKAQTHCQGLQNVTLVVGDVLTFEYEPADLVISYYCAQFIHPRDRQVLFDRVYQRLNRGGALLLFEKVRGADARFEDILISLYHDFKAARGFEAEDILRKSRSLRGVLEPFSREQNLRLLRSAGFTDVETIMRYLCFEGFLAIK